MGYMDLETLVESETREYVEEPIAKEQPKYSRGQQIALETFEETLSLAFETLQDSLTQTLQKARDLGVERPALEYFTAQVRNLQTEAKGWEAE